MADIEAGSRGIDWEQNDLEWESVDQEVRAFILYDFLTAIDLQAVDPEFYMANEYGLKTADSPLLRDRLLKQRDEIVERYRGQGRMLPRVEVYKKVSQLMPQTPSEMAPRFMHFIEERAKINEGYSRGAGN